MGRKFRRTSIVAGQMGKKVVGAFEYSGTMNGELFELWFEEMLIPEIGEDAGEDAVIIMDNASFHRKKKLYEIARRHNRELIFLPPYSPELNPIEHFWHWLKQKLADTLKGSVTLAEAILINLESWAQKCKEKILALYKLFYETSNSALAQIFRTAICYLDEALNMVRS